ncbi:unnamed protein product [Aphanomyces euteiches]
MSERDAIAPVLPRAEEVFQEGDLVWAKMAGFPFWPAVVFYSPGTLYTHGFAIPNIVDYDIDNPIVFFLDSFQYAKVARSNIKSYLSIDPNAAMKGVKNKKASFKKSMELAISRAEECLYQKAELGWSMKEYRSIVKKKADDDNTSEIESEIEVAAPTEEDEVVVTSDSEDEYEASKPKSSRQRSKPKPVVSIDESPKRSRVRKQPEVVKEEPKPQSTRSTRSKIASPEKDDSQTTRQSTRQSSRHVELMAPVKKDVEPAVPKSEDIPDEDELIPKTLASTPSLSALTDADIQRLEKILNKEKAKRAGKSNKHNQLGEQAKSEPRDSKQREEKKGATKTIQPSVSKIDLETWNGMNTEARSKYMATKSEEERQAIEEHLRKTRLALKKQTDAEIIRESLNEREEALRRKNRKVDKTHKDLPDDMDFDTWVSVSSEQVKQRRSLTYYKAALKTPLEEPSSEAWSNMTAEHRAKFRDHQQAIKSANVPQAGKRKISSQARRSNDSKLSSKRDLDFDEWNELKQNGLPTTSRQVKTKAHRSGDGIKPSHGIHESSTSHDRPEKRVKTSESSSSKKYRPIKREEPNQSVKHEKDDFKIPRMKKPRQSPDEFPTTESVKRLGTTNASKSASVEVLDLSTPRSSVQESAVTKAEPVKKRARPPKPTESDDDIEVWKPSQEVRQQKKLPGLSKFVGPILQSPLSVIWQGESKSHRCQTQFVWDNSVFKDSRTTSDVVAILEPLESDQPTRGKRIVRSVQHSQIRQNLMMGNLDPHTMVECVQYSKDGKSQAESKTPVQPYEVRVHPDAVFVCDLHSHLAVCEIIGFLGGRYDEKLNTMFIHAAFPCRSLMIDGDDGSTDVEMDPESEIELRELIRKSNLDVVGWYHSHPSFAPDPSVRDIENQSNYQQLFQRDTAQETSREPFVGLIVGTYDPKRTVPPGLFRFFHVRGEKSGTGQRGPLVYLPYELNVTTRQFINKSSVNIESTASHGESHPQAKSLKAENSKSQPEVIEVESTPPPTQNVEVDVAHPLSNLIEAEVKVILGDLVNAVSNGGVYKTVENVQNTTNGMNAVYSVPPSSAKDEQVWTEAEHCAFQKEFLLRKRPEEMIIPTKSQEAIREYYDYYINGTERDGEHKGSVRSFRPFVITIKVEPQELTKLDKIRLSLLEYVKDIDVADELQQAFVEDIVQYLDLSWS